MVFVINVEGVIGVVVMVIGFLLLIGYPKTLIANVNVGWRALFGISFILLGLIISQYAGYLIGPDGLIPYFIGG